MSADLVVGSEIAGFRIDALVGRGGMGVVYRAVQDYPRRSVALKVLAPELAAEPAFRERFLRESNSAAAIDHPNIIPIYGAGEADGHLYLAMRYVEGTDLKALLSAEGPLDPMRALALIAQVAGALDAAHARGLVHRDVKPANMLIAPRAGPGGTDHCYLSDFGLTKSSSSGPSLTGTGMLVGTIDYMAPEQIEGKTLDGRTDQDALACVLFECVTGTRPSRRTRTWP